MINDHEDYYIDQLENNCHCMSLEIDQLNNRIAELEKENADLKAKADRWANMVSTSIPEKTGAMFISGVAGKTCEDKMPEFLLITPAYGLEGFAMYKKHTDYTAPGW